MTFKLLRQGRLIAVPPPERAEHFLASVAEDSTARGPGTRRRARARDGRGGRGRAAAVADEYGAEEVIVVNITYDHADRRRSYELIAEAFAPEREQPSPSAAA